MPRKSGVQEPQTRSSRQVFYNPMDEQDLPPPVPPRPPAPRQPVPAPPPMGVDSSFPPPLSRKERVRKSLRTAKSGAMRSFKESRPMRSLKRSGRNVKGSAYATIKAIEKNPGSTAKLVIPPAVIAAGALAGPVMGVGALGGSAMFTPLSASTAIPLTETEEGKSNRKAKNHSLRPGQVKSDEMIPLPKTKAEYQQMVSWDPEYQRHMPTDQLINHARILGVPYDKLHDRNYTFGSNMAVENGQLTIDQIIYEILKIEQGDGTDPWVWEEEKEKERIRIRKLWVENRPTQNLKESYRLAKEKYERDHPPVGGGRKKRRKHRKSYKKKSKSRKSYKKSKRRKYSHKKKKYTRKR